MPREDHGERIVRIETKLDSVIDLLGDNESGMVKDVRGLQKDRWIMYGIVSAIIFAVESLVHSLPMLVGK